MKESKVHLFSKALAKSNNQHHFVTNRYVEFFEEQKSINQHLLNCISQLDKSCQSILDDIHKQETAFHLQTTNHKRNYLHLRNMLFEIAQTSKNYRTYINNQEQSIQTINDHLSKQNNINKLIVRRSYRQSNSLNHLHRSVDKQESFIKKMALKHDKNFETILEQLEKIDVFNNRITETQNNLEQKNEVLLENVKLQLIQQEKINQLQGDFDKQKEVMNNLSIKQDSLQEMNEVILENMRLQEKLQVKKLEEVKSLLAKILKVKGNISRLLSSLPPNFPIKQVTTDGTAIPLEKLLLVKEKEGIAIFSNGTEIISIAIDNIETIQWE